MVKRDETILLIAGVAILALLFGPGLFSVITGTINGITYTGANIEVTNRIFQDETVLATFTANSIEPAFPLNQQTTIIGNQIVRFEQLNRQIYAWFIDDDIIVITPGLNNLDLGLSLTSGENCSGGIETGKADLQSIAGGNDTSGIICPLRLLDNALVSRS